mmetsp:Transcript_54146/g.132372  ORF Transcript_54146/g.132372 Transcript_54146/m.132372 type:complete len:388 (-) Transcript_54146:250-1413(-)
MDSTDKAVESVLKDEIEKKSKKAKFGDNMGRVGRRHKGSGKHFDEEAARFNEDVEDDVKAGGKRKRREGAGNSSMKKGRNMKDVEDAEEDWEHSEDSEEESERRRYEEESGIRIEPFNTDMEREEGHFDSSTGHYIEDRFKVSQKDAWLEEVQDKYAHGLMQKVKKKQEEEAAMDTEESVDVVDLLRILDKNLKNGENLGEAMRRIKSQQGTKEIFDSITEAADKLLASGYHNAFSDKKEQISARLAAAIAKKEGNAAAGAGGVLQPEAEEVDDGRQWEYKFPDGSFKAVDFKPYSVKQLKQYLDTEGATYNGIVEKEDLLAKAKQTQDRKRNLMKETHGPFATVQMRQWNAAGYFLPPRTVLIRQVGGGEADWINSDMVDVDDMLA